MMSSQAHVQNDFVVGTLKCLNVQTQACLLCILEMSLSTPDSVVNNGELPMHMKPGV